MVDDLERETLSKIKHSKRLQAYLHQSDCITQEITPDVIDVIDDEVNHLDTKLDAQKYAYVIFREPYYKKLEDEMKLMNDRAKRQIDSIRELEQGIMNMTWNESKLRKQLSKLVNQGVSFDSQEYFFRDNQLMCINFQKETCDAVMTFKDTHYAKVLESFQGDMVTLIGGQSKSATSKNYEILPHVVNYEINKKGKLE